MYIAFISLLKGDQKTVSVSFKCDCIYVLACMPGAVLSHNACIKMNDRLSFVLVIMQCTHKNPNFHS